MSGPKVVRVVTREELQERCARLLAQLDHALAEWRAGTARVGLLEPADADAAQRRREQIAAALTRDGFGEIQKQVPAEIAFLSRDLDTRREHALRLAALAAAQARQRRDNARSLLGEMARRGLDGDDDAQAATLRAVANGDVQGKDAEVALTRGFQVLTSKEDKAGLTNAQRDLARVLAPAADTRTFEAWKARHAKAADGRVRRVDEGLAALEQWADEAALKRLTARLRALETQPDAKDFNLRLDSLVVDVAGELHTAKSNAQLLAEAAALLAEFAAVGTVESLQATRDALALAVQARDFTALGPLVSSAREALDALADARAAQARRSAVLSGLASLGYEVREGMASAWADKGNVVVGNPSLPGFGVEIGGAADASRLQVRAVALAPGHDIGRDRDVETIWCGDFAKLQALVGEAGGSIAIERALGVGTVPLKYVLWSHDQHVDASTDVASRGANT